MKFLSTALSLIFGFLMFSEIRRRGYSIFLAIGVLVLSVVLPILIFPISLALMFLPRGQVQFFRASAQPFAQAQRSSATQTRLTTLMCPKCGHDNTPNATQCASCENKLAL